MKHARQEGKEGKVDDEEAEEEREKRAHVSCQSVAGQR